VTHASADAACAARSLASAARIPSRTSARPAARFLISPEPLAWTRVVLPLRLTPANAAHAHSGSIPMASV
jgi:hypothetical protein